MRLSQPIRAVPLRIQVSSVTIGTWLCTKSVQRSVLVVEPTMDRATTPADVRQAVTRARQVYNLYSASDKLTLYEPVDYTRLTNATEDWAVRWMNQILQPSPVK